MGQALEHKQQVLRITFVLLCLVGVLAAVSATGGALSPWFGLLYLPVLLAAFFWNWAGSLVVAALASGTLLLTSPPGAGNLPLLATVVHILVLDLVALAAGLFTRSVRHAAEAASAHAREQQVRAEEKEAFLDTSVMMESMYGVENTLAVALIRVSELVPADVCAIFLRENENAPLQLALLTGIPGEQVRLRALPLDETEAYARTAYDARLWKNLQRSPAPPDMGTLSDLDPEATGVIVAPLRTLDTFFGLLYVSTRKGHAFTERHQQLVGQFAEHVVYPIQRARLQALATTDAMTGLDNYRSFRLRLADEVQRAYRYAHAVSLLMVDIDHFKKANDTYGHPGGDALLNQVGELLRRGLRSMDIPARYGGEEMAIICPETGVEEARVIAERLRATIEGHVFLLPEGDTAKLTISVGVASLPGQAVGDAALIEQADKALYAAKTGGRNRVRVADAETEAIIK